jgi:hypothetical protein
MTPIFLVTHPNVILANALLILLKTREMHLIDLLNKRNCGDEAEKIGLLVYLGTKLCIVVLDLIVSNERP